MGQSINVMSYNIRFDNPADGKNAWQYRKEKVTAMIRFYDTDIICVQEALHHQIKDMLEELPGYDFSGLGRDDGMISGEYSAIFFDKKRFSLQKEGTFWLSPTPDIPSKGWDAAILRICSWAKLNDKNTGSEFYIFNTHFDHIGEHARRESAALILDKIYAIANDGPVILCGDFNATPGSKTINIITEKLRDCRYISQENPYGPEGTWNAFDYNSPLDVRIDYIFVDKNAEVIKYAVLDDAINQRFPSDHLPVFVKIQLK
jgi:endonuclease/exonuclease/phosphatase family metal-dependent hydrolase